MTGSSGAAATPTSKTEEALLRAEFLAEDELIEINPMVRSSLITLVRGTYGPFEPSISTVVPLWLALALKKVQRCKILPPSWLKASAVEEIVARERRDAGELQALHFYFWEISSLLLHHAADDVDGTHGLRRAVEDLSNVRSAKLRRWMQESVRDRVNAIQLNNLCMHEIELHRPVLTRVLDDLYRIHVPKLDSSALTTTPSSSTPAPASQPASQPASSAAPAAPRTLRRVIRRT